MQTDELYRQMLDNTYEGIYFVDTERTITFWNKGSERITGFSASEVLGRHCFDNILNHIDDSGKKLCLTGCPLALTIDDGESREAHVFLHHKKGHRVPVSVRSVTIKDESNEIVGAVELFVDDSENQNISKVIERYKVLAMTDQLTGLPNRRYIESFLTTKQNEYRTFDVSVGILFMDIDLFRVFNETYGHDAGDKVLKMVGRTFEQSTRSTDLIGRFGGEEFVAVLTGIDEESLAGRAEQLRMLVENSSVRLAGEDRRVTLSIGATLMTKHDSIESAIKRADELLYMSKASGRNKVSVG